jgi:hypothetical protein
VAHAVVVAIRVPRAAVIALAIGFMHDSNRRFAPWLKLLTDPKHQVRFDLNIRNET